MLPTILFYSIYNIIHFRDIDNQTINGNLTVEYYPQNIYNCYDNQLLHYDINNLTYTIPYYNYLQYVSLNEYSISFFPYPSIFGVLNLNNTSVIEKIDDITSILYTTSNYSKDMSLTYAIVFMYAYDLFIQNNGQYKSCTIEDRRIYTTLIIITVLIVIGILIYTAIKCKPSKRLRSLSSLMKAVNNNNDMSPRSMTIQQPNFKSDILSPSISVERVIELEKIIRNDPVDYENIMDFKRTPLDKINEKREFNSNEVPKSIRKSISEPNLNKIKNNTQHHSLNTSKEISKDSKDSKEDNKFSLSEIFKIEINNSPHHSPAISYVYGSTSPMQTSNNSEVSHKDGWSSGNTSIASQEDEKTKPSLSELFKIPLVINELN